MDERIEIFTYKQFEEVVNQTDNYSFEYGNNSLYVFFNYYKEEDRWINNSIRIRLFTISLNVYSSFVTPFGFRLTQLKEQCEYNKIAEAVVKLSRTPISMRKSE